MTRAWQCPWHEWDKKTFGLIWRRSRWRNRNIWLPLIELTSVESFVGWYFSGSALYSKFQLKNCEQPAALLNVHFLQCVHVKPNSEDNLPSRTENRPNSLTKHDDFGNSKCSHWWLCHCRRNFTKFRLNIEWASLNGTRDTWVIFVHFQVAHYTAWRIIEWNECERTQKQREKKKVRKQFWKGSVSIT